MILDEKALRRGEFTPGREIALCDGQSWTFPVPVVNRLYPTRGADGKTQLVEGYDRGDEYDRLTDAYTEMRADDYFGHVRALTDLAFHLLSQNYAIEYSDMRHLLWLDKEGSAPPVLHEIAAVALGRAPKATAVGETPV